MPSPDDNEQDLVSSSGSETLDEGSVEQTGSTGADSSPAQDEAEKSVLSIVRDVVGEKAEPEAAAASSAEGEETGQSAGDPTKTDQDNENYSDVPFNKHPRFQQLLSRVKTSEADARRYHNVQTYLDSNGVSSEEAADALLVAALAKHDPAKAWEHVRPWLNKLLVAAGEVLPEELQQRVQAGEMTRDAALEVSRSRATVQSVEAQRRFDQERRQRETAEAAATSIVTAAESWEQDRQTKDPNFAAKVAPLQREIAYLHATEGRPTTSQGVKEQLDKAYKAVNEKFAPPVQTRPAPRTVRPVTGGQVSGSVQPVMNSVLDIVRAKTRQTA